MPSWRAWPGGVPVPCATGPAEGGRANRAGEGRHPRLPRFPPPTDSLRSTSPLAAPQDRARGDSGPGEAGQGSVIAAYRTSITPPSPTGSTRAWLLKATRAFPSLSRRGATTPRWRPAPARNDGCNARAIPARLSIARRAWCTARSPYLTFQGGPDATRWQPARLRAGNLVPGCGRTGEAAVGDLGALGGFGIALILAGVVLQLLVDRRPEEKPDKPKKPAKPKKPRAKSKRRARDGATGADVATASTAAGPTAGVGVGSLILWALQLIAWAVKKGKIGWAVSIVGVLLVAVDLVRDDDGDKPSATRAPQAVASRATVTGGSVRLRMRCSGSSTCRGKVALVRSDQVIARARGRVRIGGNKERTVRLRLTERGRQLVRQRTRFGARLQIAGKRKGRITVRRV